MLGKIAFVVAAGLFLGLIGLLAKQLVDFTIERLASGDSAANFWGFWLLWLGPGAIGVAAIVAGIDEWINPAPQKISNAPKPADSWVLPR